MSDTPVSKPLLTRRQMIVQVIGFAIGLVLLTWCIWMAVKGGDWTRIREANLWLVAGLVGCSVVSFVVNGVIFWMVIKPVRAIGIWPLQAINLVTTVLNYAPIRAGLVARIAYHLRVDRMTLLEVMAWFAAIAFTMLVTLGSCITATILHPHLDLVWFLIAFGFVAVGGVLIALTARHPLLVTHGRGMDKMLRHPSALWGALVLRVVDIGAFVGRMACAVAIMGLDLSAGDILLLGMSALALSLNPLGRFGFKEVAVTFVASRLVSTDLSGDEVGGQLAQLALIESAGEALAGVIPGAIMLLWYRKAMTRGATDPAVEGSGGADSEADAGGASS